MKNREKRLIIIIVVLVILLIGTNIKLVFNQNAVLINGKQIIKEMNECAQISSLNSIINELNRTHGEYQEYIQNCKTQIATALTNEGVTTSKDEKLETMASNIEEILRARTSDATATIEDIVEGKTAYVNGELIVGNNKDSKSDFETIAHLSEVNYASPFTSSKTITAAKDGTILVVMFGTAWESTRPTAYVKVNDSNQKTIIENVGTYWGYFIYKIDVKKDDIVNIGVTTGLANTNAYHTFYYASYI